jgi:hypothetical protein
MLDRQHWSASTVMSVESVESDNRCRRRSAPGVFDKRQILRRVSQDDALGHSVAARHGRQVQALTDARLGERYATNS